MNASNKNFFTSYILKLQSYAEGQIMSGFLGKLDKKKKNKVDETKVHVTSNGSQSEKPAQPSTIVTTGESLGSTAELLKNIKSSANHTKTVAKPMSSQSDAKTQIVTKLHNKSELFDDSMPWWLTETIKSSPHVDALVPEARLALNDLLTDEITDNELVDAIHRAVKIAAEKLSSEVRLSSKDVQEAARELTSLMLGKGPLQALYEDVAVTDIYLDGHDSIKCIRRGQALETPFRFRSRDEYEAYITQMLQSVDRVLNLSSPIVDCVLKDPWRTRVSAVHSSLRDGKESALVVRVPRLQEITFYDLLKTKTLPATLAAWLSELVSCGEANVLVIGPTGSGKTTLTTALLNSVSSDERIITIEDVPEIFVPTAHIEKLVSRPDNAQGEGSVGMDKLLRAALRRAPHRIVVGEIRDKEGPLFLKALETGHMGSVATIHAESSRDGLWRLLDVVAAYEKAPQESIQRRIGRSLHVLVTLKRINGRPCLTEVTEVHPPIGGEFVVKKLVEFDSEIDGKRQWRILATQSRWLQRLSELGMELQPGPGLQPPDGLQDDMDEIEAI